MDIERLDDGAFKIMHGKEPTVYRYEFTCVAFGSYFNLSLDLPDEVYEYFQKHECQKLAILHTIKSAQLQLDVCVDEITKKDSNRGVDAEGFPNQEDEE